MAGEWFCWARGAGNPAADALFNTGTNLQFQSVCDLTANNGGMYHGGNVGAAGDDFKVVLNASGFSAAATTMPGVLMLVDLLGFHRKSSVTTTTAQNTLNAVTFTANAGTDIITYATVDPTTFTKVRFTTSGTLPAGLNLNTDYWLIRQSSTTATVASSFANATAGTIVDITDTGSGTHTMTMRLPRYSDGAGVQAFMWNTNATALGAGTPNLTLGYTNSAGTASRATPSSPSPPIGKTAGANGLILYSGATGTGKMGPFLPLQAGDAGIRSIETIQNSTSYVSGEYSVALCKPIFTLPLTTVGVAGEREFGSQLPSFPRVYDGACLIWLYYSGAATPANSAFYGHVDFGWG